MIWKKSKILMIILIFVIIFNFSCPTIYATQQQQGENTSSGSDLGTAVDFGLRFTY